MKSAYLKNPNNPRLPIKLIIRRIFFLVMFFELKIAFATKKSRTVEEINKIIK